MLAHKWHTLHAFLLTCLAPAYTAVPRNLLLRFKNDSMDDSNALATLLQVSQAAHFVGHSLCQRSAAAVQEA